ncbi:MAG: hypothetical protein ACPL1Y_03505 [Thermoplasmata archaeon]
MPFAPWLVPGGSIKVGPLYYFVIGAGLIGLGTVLLWVFTLGVYGILQIFLGIVVIILGIVTYALQDFE